MSIGPDLKDALSEIGTSFIFLHPNPSFASEKMMYKSNTQTTKPFVREFYLTTKFAYDTNVNGGTVLQIPSSAIPYLVVSKTPEIFDNEVIEYNGGLYKCNVSGELSRISGEVGWSSDYRKTPVFQTIKANAYALQTEQVSGAGIRENEDIGAISISRHDLYVPSDYGVKELDRYQPVSGEYWMVKSVKLRMYDNVDMCELIEDTR